MKHLFGPVPSRRLGISLGVDLVPFKYCSMNCIYCEIGKTTNLTTERKNYIPVNEIIEELDNYLYDNPHLDYITFSGAGEPTLHSKIGDIIAYISSKYPNYKTALITNSSLFPDPVLRSEVKNINLLLPSLDAVSVEVFNQINRPEKSVNPQDIINGLALFRKESEAVIWLEIFLIPGINDTKDELTKLKEAAAHINPHRVQLNSLDRPGTENWVVKEQDETLAQIADFFQPLPVEIISSRYIANFPSIEKATEELILSALRRRPLTVEDIAKMTGMHINDVNKYLKFIGQTEQIVSETSGSYIFYHLKQ